MPGDAWYEGAHSITFQNETNRGETHADGRLKGRNTWDNWHLIPTSKPIVAGAAPNTNLVDIPGRNGQLDLTTYLTGGVTLATRTGSWEFVIDNGWPESPNEIRNKVISYLHGKQCLVVLEDQPTKFWAGRLGVEDYKPGASNDTITISYVLNPNSQNVSVSSEWLWDPFNFETDYTDGRQNAG